MQEKKAKNFEWIFGVVKQNAIETSRFGLLIKAFCKLREKPPKFKPYKEK